MRRLPRYIFGFTLSALRTLTTSRSRAPRHHLISLKNIAKMGGRKGKRNHKDSLDSEQPSTVDQDDSAPIPQQQGARKKQKRDEYLSTLDGDMVELPKKKFYRQRAHANPFSDHSLI
ncbi:hypothetical protein FH972_022113 [Carpinus fangiana]|uniref:Uncharacterized protein n=1 Tax=Carpinus fangiana TaxID=176857 RepID=A0A5N6KRM9_9ROSI|nr:hypothetical protein FH972_022113 [Carpinus fangiana]